MAVRRSVDEGTLVMASRTRIREGMTLEEFLELPEEKPVPRIHRRPDRGEGVTAEEAQPDRRRGSCERLNRLRRAGEPGLAFPELRCTFAGRSIVPDVVFLLEEHIEIDDEGEPVDEIAMPARHPRRDHLARPACEEVAGEAGPFDVARLPARLADRPREGDDRRLPPRAGRPSGWPADGVLEGEPVLPGFRLPVAEVFGWLKLDL